MIRAILDTNVLVQSVISSPSSASARTLDAYHRYKKFQGTRIVTPRHFLAVL